MIKYLFSFYLFLFSVSLFAQNCELYHTVESGQTLYSISKKYNCSVELIKQSNTALNDGVKIGQKICIPCIQKLENEISISIDTSDVKATVQDSVVKKSKYNIVMCLPFMSGTAEEDSLDDKSKQYRMAALQMYRGAMTAKSELERLGLKAQVHVTDCGNSKSSGDRIVKYLSEKQADLVIGPVFKDAVIPVIKWADQNNSHVVVPIKMSSKVLLEGKNVSKVYSGAISQWYYLVRYAIAANPNARIIGVYGTVDKPLANASNLGHILLKGDSLKSFNVSEGTVGLVNYAKSCTEPIVILNLCTGNSEWSKAVSALSGIKYKMIGGDGFEDGEKFSKEGRAKTDFVFSKPVLLNYYQKSDLRWIASFREVFLSEPDEFAVIGHDVLLYYGKALLAFGSDFQNHLSEVDGSGLIGMGFDFFSIGENAGYENSFVNVVQKNDGKWIQKNAMDLHSLKGKRR
jgi:LysM domain